MARIPRVLIGFVLVPAVVTLLGCAAVNPKLTPDRFEITGDIGQTQQWTAAEFALQFEKDISGATAVSKGREVRFRGVPLLKVVEHAQPRMDEGRKNAALALAVLVEARDGYAAAFSLSELRAEYGDSPAFIVIEEDGQPPTLDRGPVTLIVPGDKKPSRWVHGIERIRVANLAAHR